VNGCGSGALTALYSSTNHVYSSKKLESKASAHALGKEGTSVAGIRVGAPQKRFAFIGAPYVYLNVPGFRNGGAFSMLQPSPIARRVNCLVIVLALCSAAATASAVEFTPAQKARLAAGKTVRQRLPSSGEGGFYGGTGYALVNATPEVIWAAIEDWKAYPKIYPKTVSVTEVSRKDGVSLIHMEMGHQLIRAEYYMSVERDPVKRMVSFKLVKNKPHDIEDTRGYWRLFPQSDGRTLVAYVVATQIPMGIINLISPELVAKIERALLGVPSDLKKWVEGPSGERYRAVTASR
jgi:ribosome-associated toxin RatA of RatAB toxin-antitoxin module